MYTITTSFTNQSIGTINGTGVTIYLCPGAGLNLGGSSSTTLSSPTGSSGFVIFDDSAGPFNTVGVTTNLVGAIYARLADLNLQNLDVQGDVVAHTVSIQSQGVVRITSSSQKQSPTITTLLSTSSVAVGGSVNDTAALNGATPDAGGTVTYSVYSNNECTGTSRDAGTVTVTNGNVPPSSSLTFSTPGTVYWRAVYSGDAKNNGASSVCTSEQLVVGRGTPVPDDDRVRSGHGRQRDPRHGPSVGGLRTSDRHDHLRRLRLDVLHQADHRRGHGSREWSRRLCLGELPAGGGGYL